MMAFIYFLTAITVAYGVLMLALIPYFEEQEKRKRQQTLAQEKMEQDRINKERKYYELKHNNMAITFYCPECGILVSNQLQEPPLCPFCKIQMKDAQNNVVLKKDWFLESDESLNSQLSFLRDLYEKAEYREVIKEAERFLAQDIAIVKYIVALCYGKIKEHNKEIDLLNQAVQQGCAPALYQLALAYYEANCVEKNNILARKYALEAAKKGHGEACYWYTELCVKGEFEWSPEIDSPLTGYFKAAIHGDIEAIKKIESNYRQTGGNKNLIMIMNPYLEKMEQRIKNPPSLDMCQLWWNQRAAELGDIRSATNVARQYREMRASLTLYREYPDIEALYQQYSQLAEIWKVKEDKMVYRDEDCYQGFLMERTGDLEGALEYYRRAAERDDLMAIKAVRRLTGNEKYKLKVGKMQDENIYEIYQEAKDFLQSERYGHCLIQARKTLEIYVHQLFYKCNLDVPANDDLANLIEILYNRNVIDKKQYNEMNFVRRKGNSVIHSNEKVTQEEAAKAMNVLEKAIES